MAFIEAKNLNKTYIQNEKKFQALNDVSLKYLTHIIKIKPK